MHPARSHLRDAEVRHAGLRRQHIALLQLHATLPILVPAPRISLHADIFFNFSPTRVLVWIFCVNASLIRSSSTTFVK